MNARLGIAVATALCVTAATAQAAPAGAVTHCLVGTWTLTSSVGPGDGPGGLEGVKMTISPAGAATLNYTHAKPAQDGGLTATFRGHDTLLIASAAGRPPVITVKSEHANLSQTTSLGTSAKAKADPVWQPSENFACSSHTLKLTRNSGSSGLLNGATFHR